MLLFSQDGYIHSWKQEHYYNYKLLKQEIDKIQDGDIILRQGYGIVSSLILETLREDIPLSHIGIIYKSDEDELFVIHSVSQSLSDYDGIQIDSFNKFVKNSRPNSIIVVRYNKINKSDTLYGRKISDRAKYYLQKQIPFDHSFSFENCSAFFCSELVWRIFIDVFNDDILCGYPTDNVFERLKFKPFYNPAKFDIIIDHHSNPIINKNN